MPAGLLLLVVVVLLLRLLLPLTAPRKCKPAI
jgi:hypothetical protein